MLTNRATLLKAVLLIFGLGLMSMLLQVAMSY
jgi:hypothetical protein